MPTKQPKLGYALVMASGLLAASAYWFAYQAGCHFDGKQGLGDINASEPWLVAGWVAVLISWFSISLGTTLIAGPTIPRALGSALFFAVLVLPLGFLLLLAGESAGVVACLP